MKNFLRECFSETNTNGTAGCVSFARVATGFVVMGSLVWVTWIVYRKLEVPELTGVIAYSSTLYGINKIVSGMSNKPQ